MTCVSSSVESARPSTGTKTKKKGIIDNRNIESKKSLSVARNIKGEHAKRNKINEEQIKTLPTQV